MRLSTKKAIQRVGTHCCLATLAFGALTGCHSHYVAIDVTNSSGQPISLLEVDYPSASFGDRKPT